MFDDLLFLLGLAVRHIVLVPGLHPLQRLGPEYPPGWDCEETGEQKPGPQDVDGLAELLDGVAPDQTDGSEQTSRRS